LITSTNPKILTWARERCGLSVEDLARNLGKNSDIVQQWESGEAFPSYTTLETLAYSHFKVPLAVFFFPEPPDIEDAAAKFRRLPEYELGRLSSDTRQKILLAQAYQESLKELLQEPTASTLIWQDLKTTTSCLPELASDVRDYLQVSLEQQFSFSKGDEAFKTWREAIEQCGVYTFKDSFKDRFVSGFCLIHDQFPIIMVNNSNSFSRQIFTLFHELGHILLGVNGITDVEDKYIDLMSNSDRSLEIACNKFAGEVLVPSSAFLKELPAFEAEGQKIVPELAKKYSVSREVILRRLLDYGAIDQAYYASKAKEWNGDYLRQSRETKGGNWYRTRLSYLGDGFSHLAFENYRQGRLSKAELAEHLNVRARNLEGFESYIGW
jgi:Zn-dependent peptidase ImmA (M78 family)/transcriptional regulator with XRE-family HTH domain